MLRIYKKKFHEFAVYIGSSRMTDCVCVCVCERERERERGVSRALEVSGLTALSDRYQIPPTIEEKKRYASYLNEEHKFEVDFSRRLQTNAYKTRAASLAGCLPGEKDRG